jgi:hypothetical protein
LRDGIVTIAEEKPYQRLKLAFAIRPDRISRRGEMQSILEAVYASNISG